MKKKKKKKDNKKERKKIIDNYKNNILKHGNNIWIPHLDKYSYENTNSWFDIRKYEDNKLHDINIDIISHDKNMKKKKSKKENKKKTKLRNCIKLDLRLNNEQKKIFNDWFNAYTIMYNTTLRYIKYCYSNNQNVSLSFYNMRSILKDKRDEIILDSQNKNINDKDTTVKVHILDQAIKLATSNYKSAWTNKRQGNIRHFRIRYWKFFRVNRILDVEQQYFKQGTICPKIFGQINAFYDGSEYSLDNMKNDCRLRYDSSLDEYNLFVPRNIEGTQNNNQYNSISLDPGLRTFMTGLSDKEVVDIGKDANSTIKSYLERLDNTSKIENDEKQDKKKKLYRRKIKNYVDDLHWKTTNYLTKKYKNILIGDMSVKGITNNDRSNLNKMNKRIAYSLSFYKFRQRLDYKCNINKIGYKVIDEKFTSKMCSKCGWLNNKLGGNKVFDCQKCDLKIDRDINGCRGIYIKYFSQ